MKILKAYIITVIVCISVFSTVACIFIADENARKIALGEEHAVVAMNNSAEKSAANPLPVIDRIAEEIKRAASIAPPPINNIYWIMKGITENQK